VENLRGEEKIHLMYNSWDKPEGEEERTLYTPELNDKDSELIKKAGHGGGDFIVIREFFESIRENKPSPFDVYFATTIASVAILAHRSLLEGGTPYDIPDFRLEDVRREWENDTETPFWGTDGTAPTVRLDSNPDLVPNEEWIEDYRKIIADIQ
jgi:hypothetical protein